MQKKNFYITTPIYYVNDLPHIGHAYTSIAADCLARFKRLEGCEVWFLTGTDEHGQKVEKSAAVRGKKPQEFCYEISAKFRELADFLGISYDDFIRTTESRHKKSVEIFWKKLEENGWIYKSIYEGWYAMRDEAFYSEDEVIDGKAPTGAPVAWHKEESYFFRLSEFQNILLKIYEDFQDFISPQAKKNEVISFVKGGLKDLSISRTSFKWGIPVPGDEKHIIYVWLDALVNYISALGYPDGKDYQKFWEADNKIKIHIVGKDILRFHAVYWPAFLLASKYKKEDLENLTWSDNILPAKIFAHGWWTNEGQKISKSVGNIIDPYREVEWIESFGIPKETAIDYFRYFLMREVPFGGDGDYSRERLVNRINSELANNIGNLVQRILSFVYKNCEGKIPENKKIENKWVAVENIFESRKECFNEDMDNQQFHNGLSCIIQIGFVVNRFSNEDGEEKKESKAPWNLKKEGKIDEMNQVLYVAADTIRKIAIMLLSFIPNSANKILDLLNIPQDHRNFDSLNSSLVVGHKINQPQIIFPKLELKI